MLWFFLSIDMEMIREKVYLFPKEKIGKSRQLLLFEAQIRHVQVTGI